MRIIKTHIILILAALVLFSCTQKETELVGFSTDDVYSISSYIEKNKEEYSKFWQILEASGLYSTLNAYNPNGTGYTLFMPTDQAFEDYIQENDQYASFDALLSDTDFLNILIRYHLVNGSLESASFPYGALSDSTELGNFLSIGLEITPDTSIYKVNNIAPLLTLDIKANNGYIHTIGQVLEPITYSGYEWLTGNDGCSIFAQLLEITGVNELMGNYKTATNGASVKNRYTVLAEPDSIYENANINSVEDLIARYHTDGLAYDDPDGRLYQFAAYHILDGQYFLDNFEGTSNYNTLAVYPVSIRAGLDLKINEGVDTFKTVISGTDTTYINYIGIDMVHSNVNTETGPVHFISQLMDLYQPSRKDIVYKFQNDPVVKELGYGTSYLYDPAEYEFLDWNGIERVKYYNPANVSAEGFMEMTGDFSFTYTIPPVLPGEYEVYFRMNSNSSVNATVQVKVDGTRVGGNLNLTSGTGAFTDILVGTINFTGNDYHTFEINTLIPGRMRWNSVKLVPK